MFCPDANPGRIGGKPATNRLSYGTASDIGIRWDEWSVSRPGRFTPRERAPGTHLIGGCVGSRAVLYAVEKRKDLDPAENRTRSVRPVPHRYPDSKKRR
jgi:hypothetical protein